MQCTAHASDGNMSFILWTPLEKMKCILLPTHVMATRLSSTIALVEQELQK
jgi:hypothetical protein